MPASLGRQLEIHYTSTTPHQTQATQVGPESSPVDIFTNSTTPSAALATQPDFGGGTPNFAPPLRLLPLLLFQLPAQFHAARLDGATLLATSDQVNNSHKTNGQTLSTLTSPCWSPPTCLALLPSSGPVSSPHGRRQRPSNYKKRTFSNHQLRSRHPHRSLIEQLELSPTIGSTAPEPPSESSCWDPCRDEGKRQSWGRTDVQGGVSFC